MKRRFFIYSLPRSGSSWLSEFLSQPGSYCYHDPFADGDAWDLAAKWRNRPEPCVGAIDTSAYRMPPVGFTSCTKYVLLRNTAHVAASLRLLGFTFELGPEIERFKFVARGALPIYYESLHDLAYLEEVWEMVTNTPLDFERAERLAEMNIQRSIRAVAARMKRTRT
jgi:hypothetical protein